jgi:integrase
LVTTYKPRRYVTDPATGKKKAVRYKCWYVRFRDPKKGTVTRKAYTDKTASRALGERLQREAIRKFEGLVEEEAPGPTRPLAEWLDDFVPFLRARKSNCEPYVRETERQIRAVFDACRFKRWGDITTERVTQFLDKLRREDGLSPTTVNHFRRSVKTFTRWLSNKLQRIDPLTDVPKLDEDSDRRRERRAIAPAEFDRLIAAAESSTADEAGLTGPSRALLYLVAASTGLRASELASLTPELLTLDAKPPFVTLLGKHAKNKKSADLPLPVWLADRLRVWVAGKEAGRPLWPGGWARNKHAARMLRADLAAAGIPYLDARGRRFDFHSLRGQFVTALARAGVQLQHAQKLARHSTPALTANHYTRLELTELATEIERIPAPVRKAV